MGSDHVFRCLSRSRSAWLDMDGLEELQEKLPALANLSRMLAGWDRSVELFEADKFVVDVHIFVRR